MSPHAGSDPWFTFTGPLYGEDLLRVLNTVDIGVAPDPKNPMNDISTMNKIMEYMTLEKPSVQFDLNEGRASAGEASLYAAANDPQDFAAKIAWLIDRPEERRRMGQAGPRAGAGTAVLGPAQSRICWRPMTGSSPRSALARRRAAP